MRFAHLADIHIGSWRDPSMKALALQAFRTAVDNILASGVDFVIISGDFFNTAVPAIDHLQEAVIQLKRFKKEGVPVYVIPGSHDYNAGGRTIIDVLEEAELLVNVMKGSVSDGKLSLCFTQDAKTGAKITGVGGRRGSLEKQEFSILDNSLLEAEQGFKVFMFHSCVEELRPRELAMMKSVSARDFPRGFDYYAGGHVHIVEHKDVSGYRNLVYPGPLFPSNFSELWKLGRGGYFLFDGELARFMPLELKSVCRFEFDAEAKSPEEVEAALRAFATAGDFADAIVMMLVKGKLAKGRPSDIGFRECMRDCYAKGAYFVMRNTSQLTSEEFSEMSAAYGSADELEAELVRAGLSGSLILSRLDEAAAATQLLSQLADEPKDGEKKYEYDSRMLARASRILELEESKNEQMP